MKNTVSAAAKHAAWSVYVWPKGPVLNRAQGLVLGSLTTRAVSRQWASARRAILIHTPGKVGSKALLAAVSQVAGDADAVFHTHELNPELVERSRRELHHLAPRKSWYVSRFLSRQLSSAVTPPLVVISAVRDPLARNISAFLQDVERHGPSHRPILRPGQVSPDELADQFVRYFPHGIASTWVEDELDAVFGTDFYRTAFPHNDGFQIQRNGQQAVGIVRHDRLGDAGPRMLSELLGAEVSAVPQTHSSAGKMYGDLYAQIRRRVALPVSIADQLYDTRFARHFFTEDERLHLYQKAIGSSVPAGNASL